MNRRSHGKMLTIFQVGQGEFLKNNFDLSANRSKLKHQVLVFCTDSLKKGLRFCYIYFCWMRDSSNHTHFKVRTRLMTFVQIGWKHESCVYVIVFRSHQKSQGHDILALYLILANLTHDEARFSKFWFLGSPYGPVLEIDPFSFVHSNLCHLKA